MRTFLALDIPSEIKKKIAQEISIISSSKNEAINWVKEANLHITAQFIGEVDPGDIRDIVEYLQRSFSRCGEVIFSNPQLQLIPGRKPRLCWILLETDNSEIEKLIKKFRKFLFKSGYNLENRKLKFHITIFRIKKRLPDFLTNQILTTELKKINFKVSSATLYESVLRPQGPDYYEIAKFKFTKE